MKRSHSGIRVAYGVTFSSGLVPRKKYEKDHEIAALKMAQPDEGDPHAPAMKASKEKMLMVEKNDQNRSLKTGRLFPIPNKPDPMPQLGSQDESRACRKIRKPGFWKRKNMEKPIKIDLNKVVHQSHVLLPIPAKSVPVKPACKSSISVARQNLAFLFTKITPEQMVYMWNVLTAIFTVQCLMIVSYCVALASFPEHYWTCTLCFGIPFAYICIQQILGTFILPKKTDVFSLF